jgi:MATE family multidrug resistance protein
LTHTHADPSSSAGSPIRELLVIAAPTIATMTSYTLMQFIDGLMVARIQPHDPVNIAAQGNGGVWSFVPLSIFAGLVGVVNTYVAQNLGAGRPRAGAAYAWNALWLGLAMWAFTMVPLAFAMPAIFGLMGHSPPLVELETTYAQILLFAGCITVVSRTFSQFFYGLHRPGVTLIAAIAGNVTNLVFNYALIYGEFGFPALGVAGAAWGTVIGTAVEAAIPFAVFLSAKYEREFSTRSSIRVSKAHLKDIFGLGWPPALMFGNEIICWAVFMSYLAGRSGEAHNAAGWIVLRYMHLSFMPAVGMSVALTAVVGKYLGAKRPDLAAHRARLGIAVAMSYMALCALAFILFRDPMVRLFALDDDAGRHVAAIASGLMIVAAIFQIFDGLGITLVGILRGAGDTVFPGLVTVVLSWTCIIGLGYAAVLLLPQLESLGPWIAVAVYIVALGLALAFRFWSGQWKKIDLLANSAAARAEGSAQASGMIAREHGPVPTPD